MLKIYLGYVGISDYQHEDKIFPEWMYEDKKYLEEIYNNDPKDIVLDTTKEEYTLVIDYPLTNEFKCVLPNLIWTRRELLEFIIEKYKEVYAAEEHPGYIPGMFNRATSSGPYGIWGHDIGDLMIGSATVKNNTITLSVDS